jgi:hypothetical protein
MGRDGKIDYQGGGRKAGLVLLSEACGVVVSAEQSGAVQFFLCTHDLIATTWVNLGQNKVSLESNPLARTFTGIRSIRL